MFKNEFSFITLSKEKPSQIKLFENNIVYCGVVFGSKEKHLQIINTDFDVENFGQVDIYDLDNNHILDITDKIFVDKYNARNLAIEFAPFNINKKNQFLFIKFQGITEAYYTNIFKINDSVNTIRLDYKCLDVYKNTDYTNLPYFQSIRIDANYLGLAPKDEKEVYTQLNGYVRKSRVIQNTAHKFVVNNISYYDFEKLAYALNSDILYINGIDAVCIENVKEGNIKGTTNATDGNFSVVLNYEKTRSQSWQINEPLQVVSVAPIGKILQGEASIQILFNKPVFAYGTGLKIVGIGEIPFTILGNLLLASFDFENLGTYEIVLEPYTIFDIVSDTIGTTFEVEVTDGDYLKTDYLDNDYL